MEKEIRAELIAFRDEVGPKADVSLHMDDDGPEEECCSIAVWPRGIVSNDRFSARANTFRAAIEAGRARWAEMSAEFADRTVRDMALAIIRITDELGACSDAALRADKFTNDDIKRYGEEACERAEQMASNGPFAITRIGLSNNAA